MNGTLPPEDLPPFLLMVPADEDEARAAMGSMDDQNNPLAVASMIAAASEEPTKYLRALRQLVTPESRVAWGDFRWVQEVLDGCGMTSQPNRALGDPDVVYVKFIVDDDGITKQVTQDAIVSLRAIMTMVHRPKLGGWRAHGLGDYVAPELVPHD